MCPAMSSTETINVIGEGKVLFPRLFPVYAGPEYYAGLGTLFLITAIAALFNVFTAPFFIDSGVLGAMVVIWLATAVTLVALVRLLFTDPGIVPRTIYYREQYDPVRGVCRDRPPPVAFENAISTFPIRSKYCESCGTVRAPRVVHCSSDDVDMERFDHHCPWIGCCVAKRNYRIFLTFLYSLSVAVMGILGVSIAHLALFTLDDMNTSGNNVNGSIRTSLGGNIPVAIVCGFCLLFMWFIVGLTAYHTYLASHAMTTYEHIRGAFESLGNPYDKGPWYKNLAVIFTEPIRPSWVDLRTRGARRVAKLDSEVDPEPDRRLAAASATRSGSDRVLSSIVSKPASVTAPELSHT